MGSIFSLGNDKYIYIYSQNHNILFRSSSFDSFSHPVVLSQDYSSEQSEIVFQGTIYYSYISTDQNLIIKNIATKHSLYSSEFQGYSPKLTVIKNHLAVIFFSSKNDTHVINFFFPLEKSETYHIDLPADFVKIFENVNDVSDTIWNLQNKKMHQQMLAHQQVSYEAQFEHIKNKYEQELHEKDQIIESIKQQYSELMDTATKYRAEALKWRNKFLC